MASDLLSEVPRTDHNVIRTQAHNVLLADYRDSATWQVLVLFRRVPIGDEGDQAGIHSGVVEERISLGGGSLCRHRPPLIAGRQQEGQELIPNQICPILEAGVVLSRRHTNLCLQ